MSTAIQMKNRGHALTDVRALADRAFSRAAGAPLIGGNSVRLLKNANENYPAWLDAIGSAKRHIHVSDLSFADVLQKGD
jgi:cardiolipin synthase